MFTSKRSADLSALAKGDRKMAIAATQSAGSIEVGSTGLNRWWRVVGGMMMNLALGTLYAWSVFVAPLEKEFHWKRADTSTIFTIAVVVFALTFIVAGRLQDKLGPFWISLTGAVLVSLGFFLCAYTTSLTYLFICFGVIGGLGNGFGYSTPIPVMSKWFPDKRGLAVGLAVGGYGAGSAIFGPLSAKLPDPSLWLAHHLPGPGRDLPIHDRDRRVSAKEPSCRIQARGLDPGCDF
jgi:MFS family permease